MTSISRGAVRIVSVCAVEHSVVTPFGVYGLCPFCEHRLTKGGFANSVTLGKRQRYYCRGCHRHTTKPDYKVAGYCEGRQ